MFWHWSLSAVFSCAVFCGTFPLSGEGSIRRRSSVSMGIISRTEQEGSSPNTGVHIPRETAQGTTEAMDIHSISGTVLTDRMDHEDSSTQVDPDQETHGAIPSQTISVSEMVAGQEVDVIHSQWPDDISSDLRNNTRGDDGRLVESNSDFGYDILGTTTDMSDTASDSKYVPDETNSSSTMSIDSTTDESVNNLNNTMELGSDFNISYLNSSRPSENASSDSEHPFTESKHETFIPTPFAQQTASAETPQQSTVTQRNIPSTPNTTPTPDNITSTAQETSISTQHTDTLAPQVTASTQRATSRQLNATTATQQPATLSQQTETLTPQITTSPQQITTFTQQRSTRTQQSTASAQQNTESAQQTTTSMEPTTTQFNIGGEYDPLSNRGGPFLRKPNAFDFLMMGQIATARQDERQREFRESNLEASAQICSLLNKRFCRLSVGGRCC